MYDKYDFLSIYLICVWSLIVFIWASSYGSDKATREYQQQAISNNFAHWEVKMDGKTTFMWNVPTNNVVKE
jgi:hypothetical protein